MSQFEAKTINGELEIYIDEQRLDNVMEAQTEQDRDEIREMIRKLER